MPPSLSLTSALEEDVSAGQASTTPRGVQFLEHHSPNLVPGFLSGIVPRPAKLKETTRSIPSPRQQRLPDEFVFLEYEPPGPIDAGSPPHHGVVHTTSASPDSAARGAAPSTDKKCMLHCHAPMLPCPNNCNCVCMVGNGL